MNLNGQCSVPTITEEELERVHKELDDFIWRVQRESARFSRVITLGRRMDGALCGHERRADYERMSFMYPTLAGWKATEPKA